MVKKGKSHEMPGKSVKPTASTFKIGRRERGGATHSIFDGLVDEVRISDIARYDADYDVPKTAFVPDDNTLYLLHLDEDDLDAELAAEQKAVEEAEDDTDIDWDATPEETTTPEKAE